MKKKEKESDEGRKGEYSRRTREREELNFTLRNHFPIHHPDKRN